MSFRSFNAVHKKIILGLFVSLLSGALLAFPGWLDSPERSNPHDPKSPLYKPLPYQSPTVTPTPGCGWVSTVAGTGVSSVGLFVDGGSAISTSMADPYGLAVDASGNFYIADYYESRVYKVNGTGTIARFAGSVTGSAGFAGDGGPATAAYLHDPVALALDGPGNLYIADYSNDCIRKIDTAGNITTVAGTGGVPGYTGDSGAATAATLSGPRGVAVGSAGEIYIADTNNHCVRKVDTLGVISTVAGNGTAGYSGDGANATLASLSLPANVVLDTAGNLFISDTFNHCVRKVDTLGIISTVAGIGSMGYSGDGGLAVSARLSYPEASAVDSLGNLYIMDGGNNRVRRVDSAGNITTVAGTGAPGYSGDGGPANLAKFNFPYGLTLSPGGDLYISDSSNHRVRKVRCP